MTSLNIEECIKQHRFKQMFIDDLGWENFSSTQELEIQDQRIRLEAIAEKRGLRVFCCLLHRTSLANRGFLRHIQKHMIRQYHEHIIIYHSDEPRKQVWQWAIHQTDGRKIRHREHPFLSCLPPNGLVSRISDLRFSLDEEENATIVDAMERTRRALDVISEQEMFARFPLFAKQSDELAVAMRAGEPGAFDRFCEFHRRLAKKSSQMLVRWIGVEPEDAEQVAMIGVIEAARRFDPRRGYQFSTFASFWIRQACQKYAVTNGNLIRFPAYVFWPAYRAEQNIGKLLAGHGSALSDELTRTFLLEYDVSHQNWLTYLATREAVRMSEIDRSDYNSILEIPESESTVLERMISNEMMRAILYVMLELPYRDCQVVGARFGLVHEEMTLEECGDKLGITKERVRQIQKRAEEKIKARLMEIYSSLFD